MVYLPTVIFPPGIKFSNLASSFQARLHLANTVRAILIKKLHSTRLTLKVVGHWSGPPCWSSRPATNKPNLYIMEQLTAGSTCVNKHIIKLSSSLTFGGDSVDGEMGVRSFDRVYIDDPPLLLNRHDDMENLFGIDPYRMNLTPIPLVNLMREAHINCTANPGPSYINLGIKNKLEASFVAHCALLYLYKHSTDPKRYPRILYGLAGRGKPTTYDKILEKVEDGKQVGRAVWMADAHESLWSQIFTKPLTKFFAKLPNSPIDVGFVRNSEKEILRERKNIASCNFCVSSDFSSYDSSISPYLIKYAFKFIRNAFNNRIFHYDLLNYLEEHFINSRIVLPTRKIVQKRGGVPSGSGFTLLINSLVNIFVTRRCYALYKHSLIQRGVAYRIKLLDMRVTGDDNKSYYAITNSGGRSHKFIMDDYVNFSFNFMKKLGLEYSIAKTQRSLTPQAFVYWVSSKGSFTDYLSNPSHRRHDVYYPPAGVDAFAPPVGYRVGIDYTDAVSYLGNYVLVDGRQFRSLEDCLNRLVAGSASITCLPSWRRLILAYLLDYGTNPQVRIILTLLFLDSYLIPTDDIAHLRSLIHARVVFDTSAHNNARSPRTYRSSRLHTFNGDLAAYVSQTSIFPPLFDKLNAFMEKYLGKVMLGSSEFRTIRDQLVMGNTSSLAYSNYGSSSIKSWKDIFILSGSVPISTASLTRKPVYTTDLSRKMKTFLGKELTHNADPSRDYYSTSRVAQSLRQPSLILTDNDIDYTSQTIDVVFYYYHIP